MLPQRTMRTPARVVGSVRLPVRPLTTTSVASEGKFRVEKDTMGELQVPAEKYWGCQTQRSSINFRIGGERERLSLIHI